MNIADKPNFKRFKSERSGAFVGTTPHDGVERYQDHHPIEDESLVIDQPVSAAPFAMLGGMNAESLQAGVEAAAGELELLRRRADVAVEAT